MKAELIRIPNEKEDKIRSTNEGLIEVQRKETCKS